VLRASAASNAVEYIPGVGLSGLSFSAAAHSLFQDPCAQMREGGKGGMEKRERREEREETRARTRERG